MCTGITIQSKEHHFFWGRTQEFNERLEYVGAIIPRNYEMKVSLDRYQTKYAAVGVSLANELLLPDGVNEKGLMGGSFYFAHCNRYAKEEVVRNAGKLPLAGTEFVTYALTHYATIEEMKERVNQDTAIAVVDSFLGIPQHYVFQDATGASLVVEPSIEGGYQLYDNPVGVFTNNPTFDWHLTNLQNYVGLSDHLAPDIEMGDLHVFSSGKGSGLRGIPGDFTPQSRFIRAAYLKHFAETVEDERAIAQIFHILDSFDIPKGVVKVTTDEDVQFTQYTSAYDSQNQVLYLHVYDNRMIQKLSLSDGNVEADEVQFFEINQAQQVQKLVPQKA